MSYDPARDITPAFLETVARWIAESPTAEVFVVLRYLRAAGAKDYAFIRSPGEFAALVASVSDGTDIIVFRDPQLPLRGKVTPEFIARAMAHVSDCEDYMLVRMTPSSYLPAGSLMRHGGMGDPHTDLAGDLEDEMGEEVAIGNCPRFYEADHDRMISASKGGIDGPR